MPATSSTPGFGNMWNSYKYVTCEFLVKNARHFKYHVHKKVLTSSKYVKVNLVSKMAVTLRTPATSRTTGS